MRPRLWREPLAMLDARSMVAHADRYVYLRVPKAANSTVLGALLTHYPQPGLDPADVDRAKRAVVHFSDLGVGGLAAVRSYFVFTVVRNPYARTLSAYLDKFRPDDRRLDRFGARVAAFDDGEVTFRGFCRYLAAGGEAENAHWMRQTRLTGLADRIGFVGRVESLESDIRHILGRIGGRDAEAIPRAGPPPTGAARRLHEHYDDETRRIVEAVYRVDFEAFGYRPGAV